METEIDYRNGKYQGGYEEEDRNGYGIFIDDDLSFYASSWRDGKINDDTVIYISHGKYIYGRWKDNEPHGLNVFRIGDTVVLGEFDGGYLGKKVLIIFEKFNFLAILEQIDDDWVVVERGLLRSYNDLVQYIEEANLPMEPQYFSLTKFLTYISNEKIKVVPCHGSENCYFGYEEGLGIAFNSNNGVVSVGYHEDERVTEFGAKYEERSITEGNFKTKETIRYCDVRPKTQIYSLFQKIHKRSLNFKNEYFDSKIKLLHNVEELIRNKIEEIVDQMNSKDCENTFTALDLNDSLDYHAESIDEMNKIQMIREAVYEEIHIPMKKTVSEYVEASPVKKTKRIAESQKNQGPITNVPFSPTHIRKSQVKLKEKELEKSKTKDKQSKKMLSRKEENINRAQVYNFCEDTFGKNDYPSPNTEKISFSGSEFKNNPQTKNSVTKTETKDKRRMPCFSYSNEDSEKIDKKPQKEEAVYHYQASHIREEEPSFAPTFKYSNSEYTRNTPTYPLMTTNNHREDVFQNISDRKIIFDTPAIAKYEPHELSKSPVKGPSYENLSERRKRLVKEFKNLNNGSEGQNSASSVITKILRSASKSNISSSSRNSVTYSNSYNDAQPQKVQPFVEYESPCARQKLDIYESKNSEQSETILPLTINKNSNMSSYALGSSYIQPIVSRQKLSQVQKEVPQVISSYGRSKLLKENVESDIVEQKIFERREFYQDRLENRSKPQPQAEPQGQTKGVNLSGGIKKSYKYYFEE